MDEMTMVDFSKEMDKGTPVILPIGCLEGHGPHMPLGTDNFQPEFVAQEVAKRMDCIIAPPIRYGNATVTRHLPGSLCLSVGLVQQLVTEILEELVRNRASRIMVLSGHAGSSHMSALKEAARDVLQEHPEVVLYVLSDWDIVYNEFMEMVPDGDGHGGCIETARVMAIRPDLVSEKRPSSFAIDYPEYRVFTDYSDIFTKGFRGDPSSANMEIGKEMNQKVIDRIVEILTNTNNINMRGGE